MTVGERRVILELTSADSDALAGFECRGFMQPWTDVVEEMIQQQLSGALEGGHADGIGLWIDNTLVGIAAWTTIQGPLVWRVPVLAVRHGHWGRGHARALKEEVLRRARIAGVAAVVSVVHWDNDRMRRLNISLGANVEADPTDPDHCICVIPLMIEGPSGSEGS